jgi:hypothetical protein
MAGQKLRFDGSVLQERLCAYQQMEGALHLLVLSSSGRVKKKQGMGGVYFRAVTLLK